MPRTDRQQKTTVKAIQPNGTYDTQYGTMNRYELTVEKDGEIYTGEIGHKNQPRYNVGDTVWIEFHEDAHGLKFRNAYLETLPQQDTSPTRPQAPSPNGGEYKTNGFSDTDYMIAKQVAVKESVELLNTGQIAKSNFFQVCHIIHTYLLERNFNKFENEHQTAINALFQ